MMEFRHESPYTPKYGDAWVNHSISWRELVYKHIIYCQQWFTLRVGPKKSVHIVGNTYRPMEALS